MDAKRTGWVQGWRWELPPRRRYQSILRRSDILIFEKEARVKQGHEHQARSGYCMWLERSHTQTQRESGGVSAGRTGVADVGDGWSGATVLLLPLADN